MTSADGGFHFWRLPPGKYRIAAWDGVPLGVAEYPAFFRAFDAEATVVNVDRREERKVELTVIPYSRAAPRMWKLQ